MESGAVVRIRCEKTCLDPSPTNGCRREGSQWKAVPLRTTGWGSSHCWSSTPACYVPLQTALLMLLARGGVSF